MNKLKCSGEVYDEPVSVETCLACAREQVAPPCGYSYPLIKAITKQEERTGIHATAIIGCLLRAYYEQTDPEPLYLHEMLALWIGRAVHSDIGNALDEGEVQSEVAVSGSGIEGRVDVIQDSHIIDIKTTRRMAPFRLPYGDHEKQVSLYQKLTGVEGKLYIQYVDLSGPSQCRKCKKTMVMTSGKVRCSTCGAGNANSHLGARMIEVEPVHTDEYSYRAEKLRRALETNAPPAPEPGWLCSFCSHIAKCPVGQIYLEAE